MLKHAEASYLTLAWENSDLDEVGGVAGGSESPRPTVLQRGERRGLKTIIRPWDEKNGIIRLSVTSDGTTGCDWISRLEAKGSCVSINARRVLLSDMFVPTSDVTISVAVLKGALFEKRNRYNTCIRADARARHLKEPNIEVACLIREQFSDDQIEAMGLMCIYIMHKPVKGLDQENLILDVSAAREECKLCACAERPYEYLREYGFAFEVPPIVVLRS